MNGVKVHSSHESIEKLLGRFKRLTESTGIIAEVKEKMFYEKPSVIKRRKKKDAIRKAQKEREQGDRDRGEDYEY